MVERDMVKVACSKGGLALTFLSVIAGEKNKSHGLGTVFSLLCARVIGCEPSCVM